MITNAIKASGIDANRRMDKPGINLPSESVVTADIQRPPEAASALLTAVSMCNNVVFAGPQFNQFRYVSNSLKRVMPFKEWIIELGEARIYVSRNTDAGGLISFAVVLVTWTGNEWECVTRYDCAHGFPHRDILGKRAGLLYEQSFPGLTLERVLHYAISDCKNNHEKHIRFFQTHFQRYASTGKNRDNSTLQGNSHASAL